MIIEKIGVDLHSNCFTIAYRNEKGEINFLDFNLFKEHEIDNFIKLLSKETIIAVESTTNSNFFYKKFKPYVKKVMIINTNKFDINKKSKKKTDKEDAKRILIFLEAGMLSEIWIAPDEVRDLRKLVTIQKKLESIQSSCKNILGNMLISNGIKRRKEEIMHKDNISLFSKEDFNLNQQYVAENLIEMIGYTELKNERIKNAIVKYLGNDKRVELLMSIPGISYYTAASILSEIGEISRFDSSKKLCSYAGLVPILDESNKKRKQKGITKRGRQKLRYFVTFAILNAIKSSKTLKEFYNRIAKKGSKKRALVAAGRKLLAIIYEILTKEEPFKELKESLYKSKISKWHKLLEDEDFNIKELLDKIKKRQFNNKNIILEKMIC